MTLRADPWHEAELKSAMQKFVRRGEVDNAIHAGVQFFWRSPEGFVRRSVIVAIEDVSYTVVPEVVCYGRKIKELAKKEKTKLAEQLVVRTMKLLAAHPKDKSACWAGDVGREKWVEKHPDPVPDWKELLINAINKHDAVEAAGLAVKGLRQTSYQEVFDLLEDKAIEHGEMAIRTMACLRWRVAQGARYGDLDILAQGAALTLCKEAREVYAVPGGDIKLPWYTLDGHTLIGKIALESLAKELPDDATRLSFLMFLEESIVLGPETADTEFEFRDEAYEIIYPRYVKRSVEEAAIEWKKLGPKVQAAIEDVMRKRRKPGYVGGEDRAPVKSEPLVKTAPKPAPKPLGGSSFASFREKAKAKKALLARTN